MTSLAGKEVNTFTYFCKIYVWFLPFKSCFDWLTAHLPNILSRVHTGAYSTVSCFSKLKQKYLIKMIQASLLDKMLKCEGYFIYKRVRCRKKHFYKSGKFIESRTCWFRSAGRRTAVVVAAVARTAVTRSSPAWPLAAGKSTRAQNRCWARTAQAETGQGLAVGESAAIVNGKKIGR